MVVVQRHIFNFTIVYLLFIICLLRASEREKERQRERGCVRERERERYMYIVRIESIGPFVSENCFRSFLCMVCDFGLIY